MCNEIEVGDRVICIAGGVRGIVIKTYKPTACERQIMVETNDGRLFRAPISLWFKE